MTITIDDLRAFIEIERLGSFVAAADSLGLTSPALTRRIKKIEDIVGDQILERNATPIRMTVVGKALYHRAQPLLGDFERLTQFAANLLDDRAIEVAFASIMSVSARLLPQAISIYQGEFPGAQFKVLDCNGLEVQDKVHHDIVEFGLSTRPLNTQDFHFDLLASEKIAFVCRDDHPLSNQTVVQWSTLLDHNVMILGGASSTTACIVRELSKAKIPLLKGIEVQQLSTLIGFVESGVSACVLPRLSASLFKSERIKIIPLLGPEVTRDIGILTKPGRQLSKPARHFRDWLSATFSELSGDALIQEQPGQPQSNVRPEEND